MFVRLLLIVLGLCAVVVGVGAGWAAGAAVGLVVGGASVGGYVVFLLLADVFPDQRLGNREATR